MIGRVGLYKPNDNGDLILVQEIVINDDGTHEPFLFEKGMQLIYYQGIVGPQPRLVTGVYPQNPLAMIITEHTSTCRQGPGHYGPCRP